MIMMIGGRRGCGKTTSLIKRASKENLYIVCATKQRAKYVVDKARTMGLDIPFPITISELPLNRYMKEVLVDDSEDVLSALIGRKVVGASTSLELKSL
ncbi:hypothetical protein [Bacillus wiedmannii]|uniref:hypothetical protein n=1 Tax=Bacillus wiedmannii TaxID=1890302 RepID=UPI000BFC7875|nr:hypothetical protein [Bacillus wiedmannii]PHA62885.1 hypothetical protein COE75_16765 [Bacillus wiedmannii]